MACYPVPCGKLCPNEEFASLEKWHKVIKLSAGDSWVDLGHKSAAGDITNLVTTYPNTEPYDPEMVMFEMKKNPLKIEYDPEDEGTFQGWNWTKAEGGARAQTRSFENNTTLSRGVTLGYATLDTSMTFGIGGESSRSVTWAKELGISSEIAQFTEPEYQCYKAAPYLHHAKARTLGGNTYPYLELAWWVPEIYDCN